MKKSNEKSKKSNKRKVKVRTKNKTVITFEPHRRLGLRKKENSTRYFLSDL